MDILYRKLLKVGDPCFFLRASVENPFIYLRFAGIVKEVETCDESTDYRIQVVKILEDYETIMKFTNRVRFRVCNQKNHSFIDKYFYTYDLPTDCFDEAFCERYSRYQMDVPSLFVFTDIHEMDREMSTINHHLSDQLTENLKWLGKRVLEN